MIHRQQISGMLSRVIKVAFFIVMASMVALSSCADDDIDRTRPITPPEPETPNADVLFEVNMPQTMIPSTYALGADDENNIKSIEILLFDSDGNFFAGKPYYCDKIEDVGANSNLKRFSVSLPKGAAGQKFEIVILANSRSSVETNLAGVVAGSVKKDVLALLKMSHTGKWISNANDGAYKPIPMWGEVLGAHEIKENLKFNASLMRMLAKIDVEISTDAAKTAFKLHSVHLVKANNIGHIVPATGNLSGGMATAPTLPSNLTQSATITYVASTEGGGETALKNAIYTFEAAKTNGDIDATCIVLQGSYDGVANNFYRLDFGSNIGATTTYLDILRNHRYDIKVTKISGTGQPTLEDAIKNPSTNIITDLTVWDNAEFPIIVFDNTYSMGLSADDITVGYKASAENRLKVMTDYTGGWKIDKVTSDLAGNSAITWLVPTPTSGVVTSKADIKFNIAENQSATLRICYIHISAGPLRHKVKVTQEAALLIRNVEWDMYDGKNDDGDVGFTSITVIDSEDNPHTYTPTAPPVGTISPELKLGGTIKSVKVTYKGYVLTLPVGKYTHSGTTLTITDGSLIGKALHLHHNVKADLDGDYTQVSDVDVGAYNWESIGKDPKFTGTYDGGNFKIFNLKRDHNMNNAYGEGLFGTSYGATFTNIHIASGNLKGINNIGAICGSATNTTFIGCTNAADVTGVAEGASGGSSIGGICGGVNNSTFLNCSNTGTITGKTRVGGITGSENQTGTITNCINTGTIIGKDAEEERGYTGGIIGSTQGKVTDSRNNAPVSGGGRVGGIVGNAIGTGLETITNCHNEGGSVTGTGNSVGGIVGCSIGEVLSCTNLATVSGVDRVGGIVGYNEKSTGKITKCDNKSGANVSATGAGSSVGGIVGNNGNSVYTDTPGAKVSECTNAATVTGTSSNYVGGICGKIFGVYASLENCENKVGANVSGLGGSVASGGDEGGVGGIVGFCSGTVDLSTNKAIVEGTGENVGGIAGIIYEPYVMMSKVINCGNEGAVTGEQLNVGGVVGKNTNGTITDCTNSAAVKGSVNNVGGIAGTNLGSGKITVSTSGVINTGTVTGHGNVGGIVGENLGPITGSLLVTTNRGKVTGADIGGANNVGGIVGYNRGTASTKITNCSNEAIVVGYSYVGGIVGYNSESSIVATCKNLVGGDVSGTESYVGGIIGYHDGTAEIKGCTNAASIVGKSNFLGGIIGRSFSKISGCINTGKITGDRGNVGGIVGEIQAEVANCSNKGDIIGGTTYTGGIAGSNTEPLTSCSNTGKIIGQNFYVGGITGWSTNNITTCVNAGTIEGASNYVGGIVGDFDRSISSTLRCLNVGPVSGKQYIGGICGQNFVGKISACSNTGDVTGSDQVGGICGNNHGANSHVVSSMNTAVVKGTSLTRGNIGGICGISQGVLSSSYNIGEVTGEAPLGAIVGSNLSTEFLNNFYGKDAESFTPFAGSIKFSGIYTANVEGWPGAGLLPLNSWALTPTGPWESLGGWNNGHPIYPSLANLPTIPTP